MRQRLIGSVCGACLCLAVLLGPCGCSSASQPATPTARLGRAPGASTPSVRMLIKRGSLMLTVKEVPTATAAAATIVKEAGGHVESARNYGKESASLSIRVPAEQLDAVMDKLARLGSEKNRTVSTEDVTEEVVDLDATLANKKALRDRLRALLDRAQAVQDVLAIEREFTRVQSEIDSMEARLKNLKGMVAMSSLTLEVEQERLLGPLGLALYGVKWVVTKLFVLKGPF